MSVPLNLPFMEMPYSVSVQTGSYTIPAGYYSRVVVSLVGASYFTIGGNIALSCSANTVLASDNLKVSSAATTAGTGFLGTTGATVTPGDWNALGSAFNESLDEKVVSQYFRLPTGTVINGNGTWFATVELYIMPS